MMLSIRGFMGLGFRVLGDPPQHEPPEGDHTVMVRCSLLTWLASHEGRGFSVLQLDGKRIGLGPFPACMAACTTNSC